MSKSRNELKGALRGLNLSEPMRFPKKIAFKAPAAEISPSEGTSVISSTPGSGEAPVVGMTEVALQDEVANASAAAIEATIQGVSDGDSKETVALSTQVHEETSVVEVSQVGSATSVHLSTLEERTTEVSLPPSVNDETPVSRAARVQEETPASEDAQVGEVTSGPQTAPVNLVPSVTRRTEDKEETPVRVASPVASTSWVDDTTVGEEGSSPGLAPTPELSGERRQQQALVFQRAVLEKLAVGYTRIPNRLLMEILDRNLGRSEIKILLLVCRLTISFNRKFVPLSKTALERYLGLQGNTILASLDTLVRQSLLLKIVGDCRGPNQFGLPERFLGDGFWSSGRTSGPITGGGKSTSTPVAPPTQTPVGKATETPVENASPKKDNKKQDEKKNSLSLQIESETLRRYFDELKPTRKRESELQGLRDLKADYSEDEIASAMQYLLERGLPGSGMPCHSPMAYLALAIEGVQKVLNEERGEVEKREQAKRQAEEKRRKLQEREDHEEEQRRLAVAAFEGAFPDEASQRDAILRLTSDFPYLTPGSLATRSLAISRWWSDQGNPV